MTIYCIENTINGKLYIGQTVQKNFMRRVRAHFNGVERRGVSLIKRAIIKYGKENFKVSVLYQASSVEELNHMERKFISEYNTVRPAGYNVELGGSGPGKRDEELVQKIAHKNRGKTGYFLGKKFTEEHCRNLSKARKGFDSPARREARIKSYEKLRLPIVVTNLKTNELLEFRSISECARQLNLCPQNISRVCRGLEGRRQHKGYAFVLKSNPELALSYPLVEDPLKGIRKVNKGGFYLTWKGKYIGYRKTLEEIIDLKQSTLEEKSDKS